ncbi:MAG: M48 family metalloprotease, partial [Actinoallomurus sp.]
YRTVAGERPGAATLHPDPLHADRPGVDPVHADPPSADTVHADVLRAAGASGVRELTVRVGPVGGFARCFRAGDRAILLVHERLPVRPDAARFMVAHEAAHLARYDVLRRSSALMTALVCCSCLATVWPAALVPGALGVIATFLGLNRAAELGCDRLAARWTGPAPAEQAMALVQAAYGHSLRSLLTHPSPQRRLTACRTATDQTAAAKLSAGP